MHLNLDCTLRYLGFGLDPLQRPSKKRRPASPCSANKKRHWAPMSMWSQEWSAKRRTKNAINYISCTSHFWCVHFCILCVSDTQSDTQMPVLKNFLKIATSQWRRLGTILTAFSQDQKTFSNKDDGSLGMTPDGHGTIGPWVETRLSYVTSTITYLLKSIQFM